MHFDVQAADFLTIGLLVVLEGLLSADNALVMAVMVMGLPDATHKKVLSYGLVGAFIFRIVATLLALYLIKLALAKLLGGLYLLYLTYAHFSQAGGPEARQDPAESEAGVRPVGLLGDCRAHRAGQPGVLDRFDSGGGRHVAEDLGRPRGRHPRHRRDAGRGRAAAANDQELSGARGWRVRHHRRGSRSSSSRTTRARWAGSSGRSASRSSSVS